MKVKMIDATEAPDAKPPLNKMRQEVAELVMSLEPGKVAVITPEKDQSLRGLKSSFTRAGNREGKKLKVYDHDGKLYVGLVDTAE